MPKPVVQNFYLFDATAAKRADQPYTGTVDLTAMGDLGKSYTIGADVSGAYTNVHFRVTDSTGKTVLDFNRGNKPPLLTRTPLLLAIGSYNVSAVAYGGPWDKNPSDPLVKPLNVVAPIPLPPPILDDTTTLAASPVASGRTILLPTDRRYILPRGFGEQQFNGHDLTIDGTDPLRTTLVCNWHTAAPLFNTGGSARNVTIRNITVDLGDAMFRTPLMKIGGQNITLENVRILGGGDVIQLRDEGTKGVTLRNVQQISSYAGNWLYAGVGAAALGTHEDLTLDNDQVLAPIDLRDTSVSHILRLYGVNGLHIRGGRYLNARARNEGAAFRIHSTHGDKQNIVEDAEFVGFEHRVGPLNLHPTETALCTNLIFRNDKITGRINQTAGATGIVYDHCTIDGRDATPFTANDMGATPDKAKPSGSFIETTIISTSPRGHMIDPADQSLWTITGGRAINPTKNYDGPLKFVVP
jgi:hypothetical protein